MESSAFSRLHPLVSFCYFVAVVAFTVFVKSPLYLGISFFCGVLFCVSLKLKKFLKGILFTLPLFVFLGALNPLVSHFGETVLFYVFKNPYTLEALLYGETMALMFIAIFAWSAAFSKIMTSDKFTFLFGRFIPSISIMLVMILHLIPSLAKKYTEIKDARRAVGLGADSNSLKAKILNSKDILNSLFTQSLEGSLITAESMEFKHYGTSKKRTFFVEYKFTVHSVIFSVLAVILCGLSIYGEANGFFTAEFYPEFKINLPFYTANFENSLCFCAFFLFMSLPVFIEIKTKHIIL